MATGECGLGFLAHWYATQCDGEWERQNGVRLESVDNPGWVLEVDLIDTELEGRLIDRTIVEVGPQDWSQWASDGLKFQGACSPQRVSQILGAFREFAQNAR